MVKCPKCERVISSPGSTVFGAVHPTNWMAVVLNCPYCYTAIGAYAAPNTVGEA